MWSAVTQEPVQPGDGVIIGRVEGMRVHVRRAVTDPWREGPKSMKQPERERARPVMINVDWRAARWLAALAVMLGLGVWLGLNITRVNPSAFDPYADLVPADVVPSATQGGGELPVLLPPARRNFKLEPEDFAVMGDPQAPITIVEYSDYQ